MTEKNIVQEYDFLRNIIREHSSVKSNADVSRINKIILKEIPTVVKDVAPPNFHILFGEFIAEYEKLKDFILFDPLIGKNIVALGGAFSSGKSSFLNSLMTKGRNILPEDNSASTSVPTYIVKGDGFSLSGINVFDAKFQVKDVTMLTKISHGFGNSDGGDVVTLGHIAESLFFETKLHHYDYIAFLDTPGYSKSDSLDYSKKTDEAIARRQLNMANYILWFIQADAGTITENDIAFLRSVNETIPKLFILNKCDMKPQRDIDLIANKIKETLKINNIPHIDVLTYSRNMPDGYESAKIKEYLNSWDSSNTKNNFALNFKTLFVECSKFYDVQIQSEEKELRILKKAATLAEDAEIRNSLSKVIQNTSTNIALLKNIKSGLDLVKLDFFTELKFLGDAIGIDMPEPTMLDLIEGKVTNPLDITKAYMQKKKIKPTYDAIEIMDTQFANVNSMLNESIGGSGYQDVLFRALKTLDE